MGRKERRIMKIIANIVSFLFIIIVTIFCLLFGWVVYMVVTHGNYLT